MNIITCVVATFGLVSQSTKDVEITAVTLRPLHDVSVPAQETGPLVEHPLKEGQPVIEGSVLARIDDADAKSAVAEATADFEVSVVEANSTVAIESAQMDLDAAIQKLKASEESNVKYRDSVKPFEFAELRLAQAQAKLAVDRAKLAKQKAAKSSAAKSERVKRASQKLMRHAVRSPISGSVVESRFERGEWVEAGQVVARVVQTDQLRVEGLLEPSQITPALLGSPVTVQVRLGERTIQLRGTVTFVSSEAHPSAHTVRVRAVVRNPGKLVRPGLKNCTARIQPRTKQVGVKR